MSLQWQLVSTCIYVEGFLVILLLLPIISAQRWKKLFNLFSPLHEYKRYIIVALCGLPCLLFVGAFRTYRHQHDLGTKVDRFKFQLADEFFHTKIFYAERNMMLSAAMLILSITLWRIIAMISKQSTLAANEEVNLSQAKGASDQANRLIEDIDAIKKGAQPKDQLSAYRKKPLDFVGLGDELDTIQLELKNTQEELKTVLNEHKRARKASEDISAEYGRLQEDIVQLQKTLRQRQQTQ